MTVYNHNFVSTPKILNNSLVKLLINSKLRIIEIWYSQQFNPDVIKHYKIQDIPNLDRDWLKTNYLTPLLDLFIAFAKSGHPKYRDVYLDERIRYVPFHTLKQQDFYSTVISSEESSMINTLKLEGNLCEEFKSFWRELHSSLIDNKDRDSIHLLAVGDCLMNETRAFLSPACMRDNIDLNMRFLYFSASQNTELSSDQIISFLDKNPVDFISFSFFSYSGLPFYSILMNQANSFSWEESRKQVRSLIGFVNNFLTGIRNITETPFLIHNVGGLLINNEGGYFINQMRKHLPLLSPVSKSQKRILDLLNKEIADLVTNTRNAFLIDENAIVEVEGYRNCIRQVFPKYKFPSALFHTSHFGSYLVNSYITILKSYLDLHKTKVFFLDFDNTLWDGIMADGPVRQKKDYQILLKQVKEAGIILVAVSKNDPKNIRWEEMVLQPSDFVLLKINWNLKVQSIEEAANELNLGLDSFVLIDDNPVERELVKSQLPLVKTLDSLDPATWSSIKRMLNFPNTSDTEESRKRTEMYRGQAKRQNVLNKNYDYPSMMSMLQLKAKFCLAQKQNLNRIFELLNRTNQFNTTTIRYSKSEIRNLFQSKSHRIYITELADKFSDLGIVGLVIIEQKADTSIFDSFIMSCRAMGFGLEQLMLRLVLESDKNSNKFIGRFIPTDRNTPAKDLFSGNGFQPLSSNEWFLEDPNSWPEKPPWFTISIK